MATGTESDTQAVKARQEYYERIASDHMTPL